jgi:hypothetical protein
MYKSPLQIYVVWHPDYKLGQNIANKIYSQFNRNIDEPLSRGIGIPVFFRSHPVEGGEPIKINLKEAEVNAIVFLIDDKMIVNWRSYVKGVTSQIEESEGNNRIFPIALTPNYLNLRSGISKNNFLRVQGLRNINQKIEKIYTDLTHEFCRMIYGKPRYSEISKTKYSASPISLFISHAKYDGISIAEKIKQAIQSDTGMQTFFDSVDIASGDKWEDELEANIEKSALIVVQTDAYSSREWCRWEVLKAKKNNRPIVVINAIKNQELRSFPYLGNVPVIRWKEKSIRTVLNFCLHEILRFYYTKLLIEKRPGLTKITGVRKHKILSSPPELLTLLEKAREKETKGYVVIYPDPPLASDEIELLMEMAEEFHFLTPMMLDAYSKLIE